MESLVLAASGAVLAFFVSRITLRVLLSLAPTEIPGLDHAGQGPATPVFLAGVSLAVAVFLGLLPALRALRSVEPTLRMGGRTGGATNTRDRLRNFLVVSEVALALALVAGAGLFVQSARRLNKVDLGFSPNGVITARVSLASSRYSTPEIVQRTFLELVDRLRRLPHVVSASGNSTPPLAGGAVGVDVQVEERTYAPGNEPDARFHIVTPGYFETARARLAAGRFISDRDRDHAPLVAVINETLARQLWPNESAIGKRIGCCASGAAPWREVMGVVGDMRQFLKREPVPELYLPIEQTPAVSTVLFSALAGLALALAAVGLYGVLVFSVAQRGFEMGVRLALGARPIDVLALVTRQGMRLVAGGLALGLVLAIASSRAMASLLYG